MAAKGRNINITVFFLFLQLEFECCDRLGEMSKEITCQPFAFNLTALQKLHCRKPAKLNQGTR